MPPGTPGPVRSRRPLDHILYDAAQARTTRTRGSGVRVVGLILLTSDGGREEITITAELRAAARGTRVTTSVAPVELSQSEIVCLQALAEAAGPLTGNELADAAGYARGASVRRTLSSLVGKGLAARENGYVITSRGQEVIAARAM